ncbi:MAG: GIY-YIG nuclease family protein [Patescibacteria group bacterium]
MYYVYLLQLNDETFYTGYSTDLERRIIEHQNGYVRSTSRKLPIKLVYYEAYANKHDATAREKYLKTGDGRQTLKKQLHNTLHTALSSNG